jgi:succinoglycan biosynthesis protein ExoM
MHFNDNLMPLSSSIAYQLEKPFASILIPTYRRPRLVCRALEYCLRQCADIPEQVEIVVVDNCPERSAEDPIKQRFSDELSRVRYIHEPKTGVSYARNSALRNARGQYVIFLDDDQFPEEGWLSAFIKVAKSGAKAAFGPLSPEYEIEPTKHARILDAIFSRQIPVHDGEDISGLYPYLSTGNCLFDKAACFMGDSEFDIRFNKLGGEDIWMFKSLCSRNIPLVWAAEAKALESIPPERMTLHWLAKRKFHSGQIRALLGLHPAQRRAYAVVFWMGVGAIQATYYGLLYPFALVFRRGKAEDCLIRAAGGAGKFLWFTAPVYDQRVG